MDKPISVGDLAVLIAPCPFCGDDDSLGKVFRVEWVGNVSFPTQCCNTNDGTLLCVNDEPRRSGWQAYRVKRIPPLEELEGEKSEEKLREPA